MHSIVVPLFLSVGSSGSVEQMGFLGFAALGFEFLLAAVDSVRFRHQVVPGDTLTTVVENLRVGRTLGIFALKGYVGDTLAAEATVKCMLGEK